MVVAASFVVGRPELLELLGLGVMVAVFSIAGHNDVRLVNSGGYASFMKAHTDHQPGSSTPASSDERLIFRKGSTILAIFGTHLTERQFVAM